MNIGSICRREAVAINASANLRAAASLMREEHVGFVVVVDGAVGSDGARVVGVLTDRDIVTAAVARDADPRILTVGDVMTRNPLVADETASLEALLRLMRDNGVRRVPVIVAGKLSGVLSLDDVLDELADELKNITEAFRTGRAQERAARP
jgi:CBS domain-containing protein